MLGAITVAARASSPSRGVQGDVQCRDGAGVSASKALVSERQDFCLLHHRLWWTRGHLRRGSGLPLKECYHSYFDCGVVRRLTDANAHL